MNVLFVHSLDDAQSAAHPLSSLEDIQMGISYISSVLKRAGHSTRLVVMSPRMEEAGLAHIERALDEFKPSIVGFASVFSQYPLMSRMAAAVKTRRPEAFTIIGGPHASLNPADAISDRFDAVCIGEGEQPMLELATMLDEGKPPAGIRNLWIKRADGSVEKNPTRAFTEDLDSLPFPDRDMWLPWISEKSNARLSMLIGRGCPFNCTYCSNHALAKLSGGRYVRMRSPANIVAELRELRTRFPEKKYVYLEIETIAADPDWLLSVTAALEEFNKSLPAPIEFGCNFRITKRSLDEAIFEALRRANVVSINIGLESGSERVRRDVLKRSYTNAEVERAAELSHKQGFKIVLYDLIGVPGETLADHLETVRMTRLVNPDRIIKSIFFPYPGTRLHEICMEQKLVPANLDLRQERRKAILDLPGFSRRQIQRAYTWFEYNVYKGIRPAHELWIRTFRNVIKSSALLDSLYLKLMRIPALDRARARIERA